MGKPLGALTGFLPLVPSLALVIGLMVRSDHLGVTSFIRELAIRPELNETMLHFFRAGSRDLAQVRQTWFKTVKTNAPICREGAWNILIGNQAKKFCFPLSICLHDGLQFFSAWNNSDDGAKTHIVQMVEDAHEAAKTFGNSLLLLDRYFLSVPALTRLAELNKAGSARVEIVTKAKQNCVAFLPFGCFNQLASKIINGFFSSASRFLRFIPLVFL